jgi:fumarate reductase subunit D
MKVHATISPEKKQKRPFIQSGKKDTFIQSTLSKKSNLNRVVTQEKNANEFARKASENPEIANAFFNNFSTNNFSRHQNTGEGNSHGKPLNKSLSDAFKNQFDHDFSEVILHDDAHSTQLATNFNAAAFTVGNHIFLNLHVFGSKNKETLYIFAHELFHTISDNPLSGNLNLQLKPLTELNDRTTEQQTALQRAVNIAQGETGKVNSASLNEDKTRVGWEFLVEYFKTTLGEDTIVKDKSEYKPGKFLEEVIKYVRLGDAQKVKKVDNKYVVETVKNVDLLPSWCGIFAFWALHKGGVHPPKWEVGKPNFTAKDAFKKGEYLPRPGDIVIKNGYNHHALVVRTEPETVTDTKDLQNVKVVTINGNTAGSNHQGGQIQLKTDPYSYWDFYINPFFKGVTLTDEKDYKVDDRLKESLGGNTANTAEPTVKDADLSVNQYETDLQPVGSLEIPEVKGEKKEETEAPEETKVDPKEIMANDVEFGQLHSSLEKNAKTQKAHDTPENKANEAQGSAKSPANERAGKAKAIKVEKLGTLPPHKKFNADELKASILKEVGDLLKKKEEEANKTGEKPKINNSEIKEVKDKNNKQIQAEKSESVGDLEKTHKEQPDENIVEKRENIDVIVEDPGKKAKIQGTERAVAKPINEERITLEKESGKIDGKMAENDVDEQQLEESDEPQFTGSLKEKRESQSEAAKLKEDYRAIESEKLEKDKKNAKSTVNDKVDKVHDARESEFGKVDTVKNSTKSADELKRKEISDHIEKIYSDSEKSVTEKLNALETSVNTEFDTIMTSANDHFKENVNNGLDDEFTWEWAAKKLDRKNYNERVTKVFKRESEKYTRELSGALNPLTAKIANTLNAIVAEITAAKNAVIVYVNGLEPSLAAIGAESAKGVLEKFNALENSVNEKQDALTNNLAKKYADGVMSLETQFKEIMDSRKSWLERAFDAIVDAIKEIINLLADLKKALERAADYAGRIIKSPKKFFNNLVKGATAGFNSFVKNIGKHLLEGALAWVTGEMSEAGIQLPKEFDFKGILSIILQILGITVANVKEIAKKVIGERYVNMLEKGVDIGMKVGEKIFKIFTIIKNEGIAGLWEFIKEQFSDLKERLLEETKTFAITTIIEVAVVKIVSMLIPGAGFISAIKSLIDFIKTLFAKARQIVNIITGIIDTFGEILAGNVSKVSTMIENILAKFLAMAITFLAAILGLGKIGKKINDIIQKKIKDPINKAITKMMEKLKAVMTKLGIFKLMDKIDEKVKQGKNWVEEKKKKGKDWIEEKKESAKAILLKVKNYVRSKYFKKYKEINGIEHTLKFSESLKIERHSVSRDLGNYLNEMVQYINSDKFTKEEKAAFNPLMAVCKLEHSKIVSLIGKTVKQDVTGEFEGADKYFGKANGEKLNGYLGIIAENLRKLPSLDDKTIMNFIPQTLINYTEQSAGGDGKKAVAPLISLDSKYIGSSAESAKKDSDLTRNLKNAIKSYKGSFNLVKGHLINHELFGTGNSIKNLGPIPISANNEMLNTFEEPAKNLVHKNNIISLEVEYIYQKPKINLETINSKLGYSQQTMPNLKRKSDKLISDLDALGEIPKSVKFDLRKLKLKEKVDTSKQEEVDKPVNWEKDNSKFTPKIGSFEIVHDDFF